MLNLLKTIDKNQWVGVHQWVAVTTGYTAWHFLFRKSDQPLRKRCEETERSIILRRRIMRVNLDQLAWNLLRDLNPYAADLIKCITCVRWFQNYTCIIILDTVQPFLIKWLDSYWFHSWPIVQNARININSQWSATF